jgi:uncharacterized protein (UPF0548 family)
VITGRGDELARRLAELPLTYPEHGGTAWTELPAGYRRIERSAVLGSGSAVFERACSGLLSWQIYPRLGVTVDGNSPTAVTGTCALLSVGRRPLALTAPCRVIYTVADQDRRGFAYGTLLGHPESGEESFIVTRADDDRVTFTVRAFSRPASLLARAGGPLTRLAQDLATRRYLSVLKLIANS